MGMAASQARYLSLVARKSNCELEGQQINQARTALSNQSANLFNQMLGLEVPIPPSTQDFTKVQYSFTDGINGSVISDWRQLTEADPDYNYVVTHHYFTDRYTGSMKKLTDPQIQFTGGLTPTTNSDIKLKLEAIEKAEKDLEAAQQKAADLEQQIKDLSKYSNTTTYGNTVTAQKPSSDYLIDTDADSATDNTFIPYSSITPGSQEDKDIRAAIETLIKAGALEGDYKNSADIDKYTNTVYYDSSTKSIAFKEDLDSLAGLNTTNTNTILTSYKIDTTDSDSIDAKYKKLIADLGTANGDVLIKMGALNSAKQDYYKLAVPTHIGNIELTPLSSLNKEQETELKQVIADMEAQGIKTELANCFDASGNYVGGVYEFKMNGTTYFTTYQDMLDAASVETNSNNNIDGQVKMAYYNASYIQTKIEKTERALLETDSEGRFSSVKFEDNTIVYTLNMETITDEAAYKDAMNQYNYENAKYDNAIREINAKTSIIQQQDQQLELRLKQLDTEQKALTTEMEAVKKVVNDNVESSFKTFGG